MEAYKAPSDDITYYYGSGIVMNQIETCTRDLIQAILDSEEYRHFSEIRDRVSQTGELREKINAFRLHVFETQNSPEPLDMYEEQIRLCKEYDEFRKNPLVDEFLKAELRVCRIVQEITMTLAEQINLDTQEITKELPL